MGGKRRRLQDKPILIGFTTRNRLYFYITLHSIINKIRSKSGNIAYHSTVPMQHRSRAGNFSSWFFIHS